MPTLFDPIDLGPLHLPNRILLAPMTRARGTQQHMPTPVMARYYAERAGAGLIISEAIGISRQGLGWPYATGIWSTEQIAGWRTITDAVHAAGGRMIAQLWHMGRVVHSSMLDGAQAVSSSATTAPGQAHTYHGRRDYARPGRCAATKSPACSKIFARRRAMPWPPDSTACRSMPPTAT